MQPVAARLGEGPRLRRGVVAEHRRRAHVAPQKAHALAVLEVDCGVEDHRGLLAGASCRARAGKGTPGPHVRLDRKPRSSEDGGNSGRFALMRRVLIAALLAVLAAPAVAADPVEGMWQTQPDDNGRFAHVRIYPCEDKLCGVLERAFEADGAPRKSDAVGKRMIWGMSCRWRRRLFRRQDLGAGPRQGLHVEDADVGRPAGGVGLRPGLLPRSELAAAGVAPRSAGAGKDHGLQRRKLAISRRPADWLFSG